MGAVPENYGDTLRRQAALMAKLVADGENRERRIAKLAEAERKILPALGITPGAEHLLEMDKKQNDGLRQLQQITAAQAIAYDEMMAAGGPDNPAAYEEYRLTCERNIELMPRFDTGTD